MEGQPKHIRKKIHIVYYLSRGSHVDQPHLIESYFPVHNNALRLKDFKKYLSFLRGRSITNSFAWAYRRVYKNGCIWQDLTENDVIQPLYQNEYVLMGSETGGCGQGKCKCGCYEKGVYCVKQKEEEEGEEEEGYVKVRRKNMGDKQITMKLASIGSSSSNEGAMEVEMEEMSVYRATTSTVAGLDQGSTDAATQTGESKRCSTEEVNCISTHNIHQYHPSSSPFLHIHTPNNHNHNNSAPASAASTPNIQLTASAVDSPGSQTSSSLKHHSHNSHTKRTAKHSSVSSQMLKQLLSCGSVDIDESSIFKMKSLAFINPHHQHQSAVPGYNVKPWSFRNYSWGSSRKSVSGYSDQDGIVGVAASPPPSAQSLLLKKVLPSATPKRRSNEMSPRRSLQIEYGSNSNNTTHSPRASMSDNFTTA